MIIWVEHVAFMEGGNAYICLRNMNGENQLGNLGIHDRIILKWILSMSGCGLYYIGSGYSLMVDSCEPLGSIKAENFLTS
jgi:hypothetical protein